MTDLDMTALCAQAMDYTMTGNLSISPAIVQVQETVNDAEGYERDYRPLDDDAQAMALMKRFNLSSVWIKGHAVYVVSEAADNETGVSADLNRAIVECVAKMQAKKGGNK